MHAQRELPIDRAAGSARSAVPGLAQSLAPSLAPSLALGLLLGLAGTVAPARAQAHGRASLDAAPVDPATRVDHDARPIPPPKKREKSEAGLAFREAVIDPLSHAFDVPDKILWLLERLGVDTERQAVNVNAFDEVPNSTWFTNRNHVRALSLAEIRRGPFEDLRPAPPYTLVKLKEQGVTPGFNMKDAAGRTWVVKLDPPGYPQLASGADVVACRLLHAAGYNVPHDVAFSFHRGDLVLDAKPAARSADSLPIRAGQVDSLLARGQRDASGLSTAQASLFLPGKPIGHIDMRGKRPDDANDRFTHRHRRELRGLYVLMSWLGSWDTKDQQSFDGFVETAKGQGHVRHYLLDLSGSLGAEAEGAKAPYKGYEYTLDWSRIATQLVTLGFAPIPWKGAHQETGMPSVGNFESAVWEPNRFRPMQLHPAFRELTDRDGYWGAKLVASFSDAQIRAAVEAAGYDDPRARDFLVARLIERRDKTARHWFERVAPLDFFEVQGGTLRFHDLAVDVGLAAPRSYSVRARVAGGGGAHAAASDRRWNLRDAALPIAELPAGSRLELELAVVGSHADPAHVWLERQGGAWSVVGVRHG